MGIGDEAASTIGRHDTLWLGCRLGSSSPRKNHFRGEIDDLFIANRALEPREIVHLMKNNQLLQTTLATRTTPK
jgi:hypothetical protein